MTLIEENTTTAAAAVNKPILRMRPLCLSGATAKPLCVETSSAKSHNGQKPLQAEETRGFFGAPFFIVLLIENRPRVMAS